MYRARCFDPMARLDHKSRVCILGSILPHYFIDSGSEMLAIFSRYHLHRKKAMCSSC